MADGLRASTLSGASGAARVSTVSDVWAASGVEDDGVQADQRGLVEELTAALELILEQHHDRLVDSLRILDPLSAPGDFVKEHGDAQQLRRNHSGIRATRMSRMSTFSKAEEFKRAASLAQVPRGASEHQVEAIKTRSTRTTTEGPYSFDKWEEMKRERSLRATSVRKASLEEEEEEQQQEKEEAHQAEEQDNDSKRSLFARSSDASSTFSKADELKKALTKRHSALTKRPTTSIVRPPPPPEPPKTGFPLFDKVRGWIQAVVVSNIFELVMSGLIMSNTIFCGVEVDYMARNRLLTPPDAFHWLSVSYAAIFAVELFLRLLAEGRSFLWEPNWAWNVFDSIIVIISLIEVTVEDDGQDQAGGGASNTVPSVRVIRMARVVRILRIARIMRHFRSLRVLIFSVLNTLRSLFWTLVLLTLILYVFGIVFTQATTQHVLLPGSPFIADLEDAYGTVGRSMYTLFKAISGGVSWQEITTPLGRLHSMWLAFFLFYFAFTYFAVLNVVTGVFCQTAIESAHLDQEMAAQAQLSSKQRYVKKLQNLFKQINANTTGFITLQELEDCMQDEKMRAYFASIDLSIDEAFSLFKLLDSDEDHALDIEKFVTGCLKLRGHAKSIDIAMMMYENRWNLQKCLAALRSVEETIQREAERWASI